ncbi:MAG: hypothetical protein J2P57_14540 [Acidimicrobiaceae bacterium]|nr:hypothetical protein [Acidimicrobiaceae bacterium]
MLRSRPGNVLVGMGIAMTLAFFGLAGVTQAGAAPSPIQHVVIIIQENHSFDNVLGAFCADVATHSIVRRGTDSRCVGATTGNDAGQTVPLTSAPDIVPSSPHSFATQQREIDRGRMDEFGVATNYEQYKALGGPCPAGSCIPNLVRLAKNYTVSDHTFELNSSPSFEGHLAFAAATQDGFFGLNPEYYTNGPQPRAEGGGWGCDSGTTTQWGPAQILVPACVPNAAGSLGPNWTGYRGRKAPHVPTIMDQLATAHKSWKIYGGSGAAVGTRAFQASGYQWAICPSFADCEYSAQRQHLVPAAQFLTDVSGGHLPSFSIVTPVESNSQHNGSSMSQGDNWIGSLISRLQASRAWSSTAVFITYDDCGCFYDHLDPLQYNASWGVRVPMVIVSPFAKAGFTDTRPTTYAGILKFAKNELGLPALNSTETDAYGYANSFCFNRSTGCTPAGTAKIRMVNQHVAPFTAAERAAQAAAAEEDT